MEVSADCLYNLQLFSLEKLLSPLDEANFNHFSIGYQKPDLEVDPSLNLKRWFIP